jgi:SAM-dependent methyltransferase
MQRLAWAEYNKSSHLYFEQYNSLEFSKVHRTFSKFLPSIGSSILDVGSGAGRDAFALAKKGYIVTAVEPSIGLLNLAKRINSHEKIIWLKDALPALSKLKGEVKKFDFILLSAVWMHINPNKRKQSLKTLKDLLADKGYMAITLRIGEPMLERHIYEVDVESLIDMAASINLKAIYVSRTIKDSLDRDNVTWRKIILAHV